MHALTRKWRDFMHALTCHRTRPCTGVRACCVPLLWVGLHEAAKLRTVACPHSEKGLDQTVEGMHALCVRYRPRMQASLSQRP